MIELDVGGEPTPCPICLRGFPDGRPGQRVCRCGSLFPWGPDAGAAEWQVIRHLLLCRSGGQCEICRRPLVADEYTVHHRDGRRLGGTRKDAINDLCNLMPLCGGRLGGVRGCHGRIGSNVERAYANGWLVHDGTDPAVVPVVLHGGWRKLLARDVPEYLPPADGIYFAPLTPKEKAS